MINPFDAALNELREMNKALLHKLDEVIQRLDVLIAKDPPPDDLYGDGR